MDTNNLDINDNQLTLFGPNSINITLYDISGAPLDPKIENELIAKAEELAHRESLLAINVVRG